LTADKIEQNYVKLIKDIRAKVRLPIAVKLSPFFTALPNVARSLVQAGANGLVLFNRFYQPDFDLELLEVQPTLTLSTSHELRLRCIGSPFSTGKCMPIWHLQLVFTPPKTSSKL
jgi:dihydroorotate dehydrogenase (fumarate)